MAKIQNKEEQPLLGRTLIIATMNYEGKTPARKKVREEVAKAAGVKLEELIIRRITTTFGGGEIAIEAAIYKKAEDAKAIEHKSLIKKHEIKKEEPATEETEKAEA